MSSEQTAVVVVAAVIAQDGKVLLHQKKESHNPENVGKWEFPGGKVNFGEGLAAALRREVKEELSLEVSVGRLLHSQINTYSDGIDYLVLFYVCNLLGVAVYSEVICGSGVMFVEPSEALSATAIFGTLPGTLEAISCLDEEAAVRASFSFVQNDVRKQSSDDTLRILTYEVGRMNELVHKGKVYGTKPKTARNVPEFLLQHQTADAQSMLRMFCEQKGWGDDEMMKLGEERYLGRMEDIREHGKES